MNRELFTVDCHRENIAQTIAFVATLLTLEAPRLEDVSLSGLQSPLR